MAMGVQVRTSRGIEDISEIQTLRRVSSIRRVVNGTGSQTYAAGFLNNAFLQVLYEGGAEYDFSFEPQNNRVIFVPNRPDLLSSTFRINIIKIA